MIEKLVDIVKNGGVVAFPTETVYGLGADAFNPDAVSKVFRMKGRPQDNPLIVHVSNPGMLDAFVTDVPDDARRLSEAFWPGPLTLVLPKKDHVLDIVTGGLESVAVRMPDHPSALKFIELTGPLVAPSANISGKPSPTRAEHVQNDFGDDLPVLDGGPCRIGIESTVLDLCSEPCTILRPGAITGEMIGKILNKPVNSSDPSSPGYVEQSILPRSPGVKYTHYAPAARVRWMDENEKTDNEQTLYLLTGTVDFPEKTNVKAYRSDYEELTRDLYDRFRQADIQGYREIAISPFHNQEALLNRIRKAMGES